MNPALLIGLGLVTFLFLGRKRTSPGPDISDTESRQSPTEPGKLPIVVLDPGLFLAGPLLVAPTSAVQANSNAAKEVLRLVNIERSSPRTCGNQRMPAVPPLTWNDRLAASALAYARDMAARGFFSHYSPEGGTPTQRMQAAGFTGVAYGENIAAGQATPAEVMRGWMQSPGHCLNNMADKFDELGVGYWYAPQTQYKHFWVMNFGRR